jgi:hypothetical protein
MTTRLEKHLVVAHNFTADSPRARWDRGGNPGMTHLDDHLHGEYLHERTDLYLYIDEPGSTDNPWEAVDDEG